MNIVLVVEQIRRKYHLDEWDESLHVRETNGRFAKKGSPYSDAAKSKIKYSENRIRNNTREYAVIIGANGDVVIDKTSGKTNGVGFTGKERAMMKECVLTHNHPRGVTFSVEDVAFAVDNNLQEIRACHKDGVYILTRKYDSADVPEKAGHFAVDFFNDSEQYKYTVVDDIWYKTGDAERCNGMIENHWREWLRGHADDYGWEYREETN